MTEEKQIEEMALELCRPRNIVKMIHHRTCGNCDTSSCDIYELCVDLYNAGYRKQSESEWVLTLRTDLDYYSKCIVATCKKCGAEVWHKGKAKLKKYCSECGSKMKGGGE